MKVAIVTSFETYEMRVEMIRDYFLGKGNEVEVFSTDFEHIKKQYRVNKPGYHLVHACSYKKNLSIERLHSHYVFAKDVFAAVEQFFPELIYVLLPANSLAFYAKKYKKKYPNVKIYFDILDLWPESLPFKGLKNVFPITLWGDLRNKNLDCAEKIITECKLFEKKLSSYVKEDILQTLYFATKKTEQNVSYCAPNNKLSLCYLGSINNIIDIDVIVEIILKSRVPVVLHIIGDGESREQFISRAKTAGAEVFYHGKIYDDAKKADIVSKCHFGLNIMRSTVCVGLTMKSVEYFKFDLPIINNIAGDTWDWVEERNVGYNYQKGEMFEVNLDDIPKQRENVKYLFEEHLWIKAFEKRINEIIT